MARCLGTMHWPCDHDQKHSAAAKLGWLRRRGMLRLGKSDSAALENLGFKRAHTDPSHRRLVRFHQGGKWWELPKPVFRDLVKAAKEEARQKHSAAKAEEAAERELQVWRRAEHAAVIKRIKRAGGIKPNALPSGSGKTKPPEYEEWQGLPRQVRVHNKRDSRVGRSLDDMAATIAEEFPELGIKNGDDLAKYLEHERLYRRDYRLKKHAA